MHSQFKHALTRCSLVLLAFLMWLVCLGWLTPSAVNAQSPSSFGAGGRAAGINNLKEQPALTDELSEDMIREIREKISQYETLSSSKKPTIVPNATVAQPIPYHFFPHAGTLGRDIYIGNFVDQTHGQGIIPTAWDCSNRTYSGHTGEDSLIRSFHEQAIGQPVFAAMTGRVVGWRDDAFDGNTSCTPGVPVNYILLDHGQQQYSIYLHFRQFSIPPDIKVVGLLLKAGTQLGLTGSSGCSTWPHLHFETWFGGFGVLGLPGTNLTIQWPFIYDSFPGPCNAVPSGWTSPAPFTGLQTYAKDIALSASPFPNSLQNGFTDVLDVTPRVATFTTNQTVAYRPELINIPAGSNYDVIFTRPDGAIHFRDAGPFNNPTTIRNPVGPWWFANQLFMTGTWRIDLFVNGLRLATTFFQVVSSPAQIVNRPPRTPTLTLEPTHPQPSDVLFCRVTNPLTDRDPDTDVVSYRYEWKVNGVTRRVIASSAGLADALPADEAKAGDTVTCSVTPSDGRLAGAVASANIQVGSTPTVQFALSTQSVNESAGFINITVTRSGDLSGFASVDYETLNGTASDRSDYTAALGTLLFAPGEASKSFKILITDDLLQEPVETINLLLHNATGAAVGLTGSSVISITSNDSLSRLSPVKDGSFSSDFFVRQHYSDFLNREADASGLAFWKNEIDSCTTQACFEVKRVNVSAAFFLSIEFQETGYFIYLLHQAAFASGEQLPLRIFLAEAQDIGDGVIVGAPGWQQQVDLNKQAVVNEFVQTPEFLNAYPFTLSAAQFVDLLNSNTKDPQTPASGALTLDERNQLVSDLSLGRKSRAQVVRIIAENSLFRRRQSNKAFVLMQYFGYLRRNPNDLPDRDFSGYNFWLTKLNQFGGDFVRAEMVKAFITSTEYQLRFGL
jgi:murein DD-endopeptidase MepM/ murein hydrolase activator NlpD